MREDFLQGPVRFEMQAGMLLPLLLLLLLPAAQVWAMPVDSGLDWTQCQQLSQQLCTLAWNAHPLGAHVVSDCVSWTSKSQGCERHHF